MQISIHAYALHQLDRLRSTQTQTHRHRHSEQCTHR